MKEGDGVGTYVRDNELYHHGILGMKWGKRNGPPYPLSPSAHSRSEKSAGWKKSLSGRNPESYANRKDGIAVETVSAVAAIGIYAAFLGIVTAVLKHKVKKEREEFKQELEDRKNESEFKNVSELPKMKTKSSTEDNAKVTNPGFPNDSGRIQNCTFCTTAMAMREKGYDVQAKETDHPYYSDDLFKTMFNSEEVKMKAKSGKEFMAQLESNPDGSYGNLSVAWKNYMGGHSVFWKKENGKVTIYDGQSGETYDTKYPNTSQFLKSIEFNYCSYNRLDNVEPTDYTLGIVEPRKK